MVIKESKKKMSGRNFALTIILGVFIAIMVITLFNLIVSYVYEAPKYEDFCRYGIGTPYPVKYGVGIEQCLNCTFSQDIQAETDACTQNGGISEYNYNEYGCTSTLKACNMCNKDFENATNTYNRRTFYVFASLGFALIVIGLSIGVLLLQIITLPAGAFLVIEAAVKNFDDKLFVILLFGLLIIAAVYLALKKLR